LRQHAVARVVEKVFARLGFRITQRKLGQAVPVVGVLFGAGMNAKLLMSVTDDAEHVYRERFLRERYGLSARDVLPAAYETIDDAEVIDVVEVLDEELGQEGDDPDAGGVASADETPREEPAGS
jgi:hypothetical protein